MYFIAEPHPVGCKPINYHEMLHVQTSGWQTYVIVTWVNDTEHTKIIDKQCRLEVEKG